MRRNRVAVNWEAATTDRAYGGSGVQKLKRVSHEHSYNCGGRGSRAACFPCTCAGVLDRNALPKRGGNAGVVHLQGISVAQAQRIAGEVIVGDNGSADGSQAVAERNGRESWRSSEGVRERADRRDYRRARAVRHHGGCRREL